MNEDRPYARQKRITRRLRNASLAATAIFASLWLGADALDGLSWIPGWINAGRIRIVVRFGRVELTIVTSEARYPTGEWGLHRPASLDGYRPDWSWTHAKYFDRIHADLRPLAFGSAVPALIILLADGLHAVNQAEIRNKRKWRGLCMECEYPRTGLAADSPCPECGLAPERPKEWLEGEGG